jgi:ABC-type uncharacterized transport system ATPase subunit
MGPLIKQYLTQSPSDKKTNFGESDVPRENSILLSHHYFSLLSTLGQSLSMVDQCETMFDINMSACISYVLT